MNGHESFEITDLIIFTESPERSIGGGGVFGRSGYGTGPTRWKNYDHISGGHICNYFDTRTFVTLATSRRVWELPRKFNIDRFYYPAVARHWENYFAYQIADILSIMPQNIDEHWAAIKNCLFSDYPQVVDYFPKGYNKI